MSLVGRALGFVACLAFATDVVDGVVKIQCPMACGDLHPHWFALTPSLAVITTSTSLEVSLLEKLIRSLGVASTCDAIVAVSHCLPVCPTFIGLYNFFGCFYP
jgi:hypothetical protein